MKGPSLLLIAVAALALSGCDEKIDFGIVRVGQAASRSAIWKNTSPAPETLTVGAVTGEAAGEFETDGAGQTNLQPGESASILWTFHPGGEGVREASCRVTATIENNLPFAARTVTMDYHLRGTGRVVP